MFNRFYLNALTLPSIAAAPLTTLDGANLKQMVHAEVSVPVTDVRQRVSFVKLSEQAARVVGVKPGTAGMHLESATAAGRISLYFEESFIPPSGRRLDISAK